MGYPQNRGSLRCLRSYRGAPACHPKGSEVFSKQKDVARLESLSSATSAIVCPYCTPPLALTVAGCAVSDAVFICVAT